MEKNAMELLTSFVKGTIAPLLIWKAGRNSESIRTMATQTLYSISCACPAEVYEIYPQLAKQFIALVEDEVAVTRAYTLKCVLKSGPFCYEDYRQLTIGKKRKMSHIHCKSIFFSINSKLRIKYLIKKFFCIHLKTCEICIDILSRLDDPCASVRGLAIECLAQIDVDRNDSNYSETICPDLAESVISRLFLYFDDPFVKLRPILLGNRVLFCRYKFFKIHFSYLNSNGFSFILLILKYIINYFILSYNLDTLAKLKIKHPISFEKEVNKLPHSYLYMNEINELRIKLCQLEK